MFTKRTKLTPVVYLLLGLLLGFLASKIAIAEKTKDTSEGGAPIRIVEITINESQQEELFAQLRKFADEWAYAIRIAPTSSSSGRFLIQMWREDIKLIGVYPSDPGELKIGFYYTYPAIPVPKILFDREISDLRNFISEIPGSTLTVRPVE
jgi:hypothetical protein